MTNYAKHAHLLHDRISAFRKGHSTTTALMGVRDDIRYAMKRKEVALMVLADFAKAFDTISFSATIVQVLQARFLKTLSQVAIELSIWPLSIRADRR